MPGLREIRVPGRLEQIDRGQGFLALVDYAHKPEALRSVLTTLAHPDRRLAVVFGAGGDRDPGKRAPMGRIAAQLADLVVVTDDNPRDEDPRRSAAKSWLGRPKSAVMPRSSRSQTGGTRSGTRLPGRAPATWCSSPAKATRPGNAAAGGSARSTTGWSWLPR